MKLTHFRMVIYSIRGAICSWILFRIRTGFPSPLCEESHLLEERSGSSNSEHILPGSVISVFSRGDAVLTYLKRGQRLHFNIA